MDTKNIKVNYKFYGNTGTFMVPHSVICSSHKVLGNYINICRRNIFSNCNNPKCTNAHIKDEHLPPDIQLLIQKARLEDIRQTLRRNTVYKTRMCIDLQKGHCRFGNHCNFAHGTNELRPRICPSICGGICVGDECEFKHIL